MRLHRTQPCQPGSCKYRRVEIINVSQPRARIIITTIIRLGEAELGPAQY